MTALLIVSIMNNLYHPKQISQKRISYLFNDGFQGYRYSNENTWLRNLRNSIRCFDSTLMRLLGDGSCQTTLDLSSILRH